MTPAPAARVRHALLALVLAIGGAWPGETAAQTLGTAEGLLEALHLKARLAPAPPFVADRSGTREQSFIPAGRTGATRPVKPMTPAELAAATADLDDAREQQQRRAGRVPARVPEKPPAAAAASNR